MPKYGTFRYGRIAKYGRYNLVGGSKAIGPYVQYRMRNRSTDGAKTPFLSMASKRIDVPNPTTIDQWRIKANDGEWVYMQSTEVNTETLKVKIRTIGKDGQYSPWVIGEVGTLKSQ